MRPFPSIAPTLAAIAVGAFLIATPVGAWIVEPIEDAITSQEQSISLAPPSVNFQGVLTDDTGAPLPDGPYSVTFRIYDAPAGGTLVWNETQSVSLDSGLFTTLLGANTPLDSSSFDQTPRYLELQVGADPPMTPRQQFTAVPYAFFADDARQAGVMARLGHSVTAVDTTGDVGQYTSLAIGVDGLPVVSYYDATNGDLKVLHCGDTACTSGNTITTVDSSGDVGQYSSLAIGADGFPVIGYYDGTSGDLKVAKCSSVACSATNIVTTAVGDSDDVGRYASAVIGQDALPIISYQDASDKDLMVVHCGTADCTSGNTITAVDTAGDVGMYSSIIMSVDDTPLIFYHAATSTPGLSLLKSAFCFSLDCTSFDIDTLNPGGGLHGLFPSAAVTGDGSPSIAYVQSGSGVLVTHCDQFNCQSAPGGNIVGSSVDDQGPSLTVGPDGLPIIAFPEPDSGGRLVVKKCYSVMCGSGPVRPHYPDPATGIGKYASMTLGTDGLPVISYYDESNGDLKVAHCSNLLCQPWNRRR